MSEPTAGSVAVLIVDDHQLLSHTLAVAMGAEGVSAEVAALDDHESLLARVRSDPPDLVLLDLELGGVLGDGVTLVRPFVEAGARVLVVSGTDDPVRRGAAVEQGAHGLVHKAEPFEELLARALAAARGEPVMGPAERDALIRRAQQARSARDELRQPFTRLTSREQQVLNALGRGRSVARIAEEWFVSESTVRAQVRAILTKLGVGSQLEAVALALRAGWLGEPD